MLVETYKAKLHTLSFYATQLLTTEEERSYFLIKGLNYDLQVLFLYMTSAGKGFNEVSDYVKNLDGVT